MVQCSIDVPLPRKARHDRKWLSGTAGAPQQFRDPRRARRSRATHIGRYCIADGPWMTSGSGGNARVPHQAERPSRPVADACLTRLTCTFRRRRGRKRAWMPRSTGTARLERARSQSKWTVTVTAAATGAVEAGMHAITWAQNKKAHATAGRPRWRVVRHWLRDQRSASNVHGVFQISGRVASVQACTSGDAAPSSWSHGRGGAIVALMTLSYLLFSVIRSRQRPSGAESPSSAGARLRRHRPEGTGRRRAATRGPASPGHAPPSITHGTSTSRGSRPPSAPPCHRRRCALPRLHGTTRCSRAVCVPTRSSCYSTTVDATPGLRTS